MVEGEVEVRLPEGEAGDEGRPVLEGEFDEACIVGV